jgi:hypothetical protein
MTRETEDELVALANERQAIRDRLSRCTDTFGQMLLTGRLIALHRREDDLRASERNSSHE